MNLTESISAELFNIARGSYTDGFASGFDTGIDEMLTDWVGGDIEPDNEEGFYIVLCLNNKTGIVRVFQHAAYSLTSGWNEEIWLEHSILAYKRESKELQKHLFGAV